MKLLLKRRWIKPNYTIGELYIDDKFFCHVLEDTVRDLNKDGDLDDKGETKIYGKTAIPYGTYPIEFKKSPSFHRIMPYLKNIKGFSGVMIHYGNDADDTLGCLLVGRNTSIGRVEDSRITFSKLWSIINGQKNLTIEIS